MPTLQGMVYDANGDPAVGRVVRVYRRDTGALLGSTSTNDGSSIPGDSSFASVSLLMHMDGVDGATSFVDSSSYAHSPSASSPGSLKAVGAKFGSAGFSPNAGGAVSVPSHSSFALPGNFTIECWFYVQAFSPALASLINIGSYASGVLLRVESSQIEAFLNGNSVAQAVSISSGAWHHIHWSRNGGTTYLGLDGASLWSGTHSGSIPAGAVLIGRSQHDGGEYINGYIDDVRITKGLARYTGSYTVPTRAFPNSTSATPTTAGSYSLDTSYTGEVQRVVLDDAAGDLLNDLIDRVVLS